MSDPFRPRPPFPACVPGELSTGHPRDGRPSPAGCRGSSGAGGRRGASARGPRCRRRRSSCRRGRSPCSAANFCTASALPGPHSTGLTTSPVSTPSFDLEAVAQDVVDAEVPRHRLDLVARRRRRRARPCGPGAGGRRRARASPGRSTARSSGGTAARPSRRDPRGPARATPRRRAAAGRRTRAAAEAGADRDAERAHELGEADLAVAEPLPGRGGSPSSRR